MSKESSAVDPDDGPSMDAHGKPPEPTYTRTRSEDALPAEPLPDLSESVRDLRRARGGDQEALANLFRRYEERLLRILRVELRSQLGRFVEPEDILQEVYLIAQRRIGDFERHSHSAFLSWLTTIARHKVKDLREKKKEDQLDLGTSDSSSPPAQRRLEGSFTDPGVRALKNELRDMVDDILAGMSEDHRRIILLKDYYGAEWGEIETELQRSYQACHELYRRAIIRLKLEVGRRMDGGSVTQTSS